MGDARNVPATASPFDKSATLLADAVFRVEQFIYVYLPH